MHKIYVVEDDDNIRDMLLYALTSAEFEAQGFPNGNSLWDAIDKCEPSLLLLDIMLPFEDGLTILKRMKQTAKLKAIPVIMLTAKGSEYDRIKGLDLGADDYITKPFSVLEVISRTRAVLRRCIAGEDSNSVLTIDKVSLHTGKRNVFACGEEVTLTYKEFELLHYLMLNEGIVLTRDKLLKEVWGYSYTGESRTVDMHIRSLRQKLGDASSIVKTVRNVGYKVEDSK